MDNPWDERYAQPFYSFGVNPNDFLASQEVLILSGGKRVLCLGEGEGRNAIWLAQMGLDVTAVDLSSVGLRNATERAERLGVQLKTIQADLGIWQIEVGRWDLIVSIFCHLPSEIRRVVHKQVVRGLGNNGLFILEAYAPSQLARKTGGPSTPDMLASAGQLKGELEGLEFIRNAEVTREVVEGARHKGLADVVQLVAQKRV